jgi:murein DD-endopeptidase MepM/ murein hydrolase activator NlpD
MPAERDWPRKKTDQYQVVFIPIGQGGKSRSFRASTLKLWLLGAISLLVVASVTLAALIYTPLVKVVPIPSAVLEERYGRQLVETQSRLRALAEEVIAIREYNRQLQRALGGGGRDSGVVPLDTTSEEFRIATDRERVLLTESTLVAEYGQFEGDTETWRDAMTTSAVLRAELPLVNPVSGIISQRFNPDRLHFGIDYASTTGSPVFAAASGQVVFAGWTPDDGNMLMIAHGGGYLSVYKHNQSLLVTARVPVKRGEPIALLGSTGRTSRGPHVHFEVWKDGIPLDPEALLLSSLQRSRIQ